MTQQPPDLVERVIAVPSMLQRVVPDSATDLVENLGAQPHDVEGVEDGDGVGELVADRVGIAMERVQGACSTAPMNSVPCCPSQPA